MFASSDNFKFNVNAYYALESIYNFLKDGDISKERNEENLNISVIFDNFINMNNDISIYGLNNMTNNKFDINIYTNEMINSNLLGYDDIIKINFIKNRGGFILYFNNNFITILIQINHKNNKYIFSIRNAKSNKQYDFYSFDDLLIHLFNEYNLIEFDELIVLSIYKKFECDINKLTGIDIKSNYKLTENQTGYIDTDSTILHYDSDGEDSIFLSS
jgi:hypothetical protein